jgi:hypothetical protein
VNKTTCESEKEEEKEKKKNPKRLHMSHLPAPTITNTIPTK